MRIKPEYDMDVNPVDLEFNWTCTNFTEYQIYFEFNFRRPHAISYEGVSIIL